MCFSGHNRTEGKKPKMLSLETVGVNCGDFPPSLKKDQFKKKILGNPPRKLYIAACLSYHLGVYISLHRPPYSSSITSGLQTACPTPAKTRGHFLTRANELDVNMGLLYPTAAKKSIFPCKKPKSCTDDLVMSTGTFSD